jgi:hypothetical protein
MGSLCGKLDGDLVGGGATQLVSAPSYGVGMAIAVCMGLGPNPVPGEAVRDSAARLRRGLLFGTQAGPFPAGLARGGARPPPAPFADRPLGCSGATPGTAKISSTPTTARHARAMSLISLKPMR